MTLKRWTVRPQGSNWGDFGADDQLGRINNITPERRMAAMREVNHGLVFSLSIPLDYPGGSVLYDQRSPPVLFAQPLRGGGHNYNFELCKVVPGATDIISDDGVTLFTQYSTQWDALGHMGYLFDADGDGVVERRFYNGYRADIDIVGPTDDHGPYAHALGIENLARTAVQGRGVLVDLHGIYGREPRAIGYDEFMQALDRQGVAIESGDMVCIYTGFADLILEMKRRPDAGRLASACAALDGRDQRLLRWIDDSGLAAICADNLAVELPQMTGCTADNPRAVMPLHELCLFKLGIHLGELWYFRELATWLAEANRWRFLLTAPPLNLPGNRLTRDSGGHGLDL